MIELKTPAPDAVDEVPRVEVFSIDGKVYSVPDKVRPNLIMGYLLQVRRNGLGQAESWLAEKLLGTEALEALINFEGLEPDQMNQVIEIARSIAWGEERPKALTSPTGATKPSKAVRRKPGPTPRS